MRADRIRALRLLLSVAVFTVSVVGIGVRWNSSRLSLEIESILEAAGANCGNGVCDGGETKQSCPQDCRPLLKLLRQRRERAGRVARPSASETATLGAGDSRGALTVDGRERTYLLHQPSGYDPDRRYPLVVVLHGTLGTGEKVSRQTRFSSYADRERFIVVYPDAIHNWNDGRGTSQSAAQAIDDVAFIKTLVADLSKAFPIDPARVYATGVSSGGIMSYRLGCEVSELFAAIAPVIANVAEPIASGCLPSAPLAVVAINGVDDPAIPLTGGDCCKVTVRERERGEGGRVISQADSLAIFAQRNGCARVPQRETLPVQIQDGTMVEKRAYSSCADHQDVVAYAIYGGGHAWPPNPPQAPRITGVSSQNIDATQVVWEFFKRHPKQTERGTTAPTR